MSVSIGRSLTPPGRTEGRGVALPDEAIPAPGPGSDARDPGRRASAGRSNKLY